MPKGGDLAQYDRSTWDTRSGAREAFYGLCRESGFGRAQSAELAERGARQFGDDVGLEPSAPSPRPSSGRCARRVPWPWETPGEGG